MHPLLEEARVSSQIGIPLIRRAVLGIPAVLLFLIPASTAAAQDGDPDQPMIVGMVPGPVAAVDMFLKIDGIDGESVDEAHSDWIEVQAITWGPTGSPVRATTAVRQRGTERKRPGRVKYGDITLKKGYDASSANLVEACANGKHIANLVLEWTTTDTDGSRYMRIQLQDVTISSYRIDATGGDRPTESITLNYAEIKTSYISQEQRGKFEGGNIKAEAVER